VLGVGTADFQLLQTIAGQIGWNFNSSVHSMFVGRTRQML
jgi:hypothetical protein